MISAEIKRNTRETQISMELSYPADGITRNIDTGCGFLNHMIDLMCHRANLGINVKAVGDVDIDYHHLTEDTGIAFGQALKCIAEKCGKIKRYGWSLLPMDGSLARIALDFSGRGGSYWSGNFKTDKCGDFDLELVPEFFSAMAREGGITIHIAILEQDNSHHIAEAIFKGVGLALAQSLELANVDPSTKGAWL